MKKQNVYQDGDSSIPLEDKIFKIIAKTCLITAVLGTVFNFFFFSGWPTIITFICSIIMLIIYYLASVKKMYSVAKYLLLALGFITFPLLWIYNGGLDGGAPYFFLLFSACNAIVFTGFKKLIIVSLLIINTIGLIIFEYNYPNHIVGYTSLFAKYADNIFSLIISLSVIAILFVVILKQYEKEYQRANETSIQLERKTREIERIHLERLHIVGEVAASIGHEVRNPLTTVRGFLQLMQRKDKYVDERKNFNLMIEELDRANSILTEFLSLAKNKSINLVNGNINRIVMTLLPLLEADALRMGKNLLVELQDIPNLLLDENDIRQSIINLVRNGFEAIDGEGTVIIRTFQEGNDVILEIIDNGNGIPDKIIDKLGTPFFTTKIQGTGLGLPVCYKIAERHNAKFDIRTSAEGSSFSLRFSIPESSRL